VTRARTSLERSSSRPAADTCAEDWALQELLTTPRQRRISLSLLASSYVTWTYQTHTFSNSVETIAVLWSLVLMDRISKSKSWVFLSPAALGLTIVFGVFNRITFPAFLILPAYRLVPHFLRSPFSALPLIVAAGLTAALAISVDTFHYAANSSSPIVTPLNNLLYNSKTENLAHHGLHPYYTHLVANLPQLLGPALLLLRTPLSTPVLSAVGGILGLSALPHQEARFLLPVVPLLLTSVALPQGLLQKRTWIASWVIFNAAYGALLGIYHQAGIVPAQTYLATTNATDVLYWKTYNAPTWLLGPRSGRTNTTNLMGAPVSTLLSELAGKSNCTGEAYLAAPFSASKLDPLLDAPELPFRLEIAWNTRVHLNMDDLDFGEDGLAPTLQRVIGRRGMGVWRIRRRECENA